MSKRPKWHVIKRNLEKGDVVLIKGLHTKMHRWPLGIIESATPNKDGLVRKVKIRTLARYLSGEVDLPGSNNEYNCRIIERSIHDVVLMPSDEEASETLTQERTKIMSIMKGGLHEQNPNTKDFYDIQKSTPQLDIPDPRLTPDPMITIGRKRTHNLTLGPSLLTILFLIGSLLMATATKIVPIQEGGLFFTHLGIGHMIVSEAKLQFMTNLSPKNDIQLIENTTNTFQDLCRRISTYTRTWKICNISRDPDSISQKFIFDFPVLSKTKNLNVQAVLNKGHFVKLEMFAE